jgi:hypothetical protein
MSVALAACGSAGSAKTETAGWTLAQKSSYLTSCHHIAVRHIKGLKVSSKQRDNYCAKQLQLAQKYNPKHKNVHGFVGAYMVTSP